MAELRRISTWGNAEINTRRLANQFFFGHKRILNTVWAGFRGTNSANLGQNIFEVSEDFGTSERRNAIGIISIRGDEIFTSGTEMFIEYITLGVQDELWADSYEGDDIAFMGMGILKKKNEVPHGISMGANGFVDKIKSVEISHERTRKPHEPLKDKELSIFQTEL